MKIRRPPRRRHKYMLFCDACAYCGWSRTAVAHYRVGCAALARKISPDPMLALMAVLSGHASRMKRKFLGLFSERTPLFSAVPVAGGDDWARWGTEIRVSIPPQGGVDA